MVRSVGAVAAGYIVFAGSAALLFQLSGQPPHAPASAAFKIGSIVWGCVFALVAGWLTGRVAGHHQTRHALVIGLLIAAGALVSLIARPGDGAVWSQLATLLLMAPLTVGGGVLASRRPE